MIITKSNVVLTEKPKSGSIKTTVVNATQISNLEDLIKIVLTNPFNAAHASGTKTTDWLSQQMFVLDFDSGFSLEDFMKRCRIYSLIPSIVYLTYSDSPELRKYRAVFILDSVVTDQKEAKWIQIGLIKLFPECDKACSDICRMYYPGKSVYFTSDELNEKDFFTSLCLSQCPNSDDGRFYEKFDYKDDGKRPDIIKNYRWQETFDNVKIMDLFFRQNYRVSYDILFGLVTSLQYVEGGLKKMFERMIEINKLGGAPYFPEESNRKLETYPLSYFAGLKSVKRFNYKPKRLENFSPFPEDHDYSNLLESYKIKRGNVIKLKEREEISLHDASLLLNNIFQKVLNKEPFKIEYSKPNMLTGECSPIVIPTTIFDEPLPERPIYIIKITTGAGKTKKIEDVTDSLIAFPTHDLKEEVSERMKIDHKLTPKTPEFSISIINETINNLRESGLYSEVSDLMKSMSMRRCSIGGIKYVLTDLDVNLAISYVSENNSCRLDTTSVLTTHTRAINDMSFKHERIIFDEDPLNHLLNMSSCKLSFSEFDDSPYKDFIKNLEEFLREKLGKDYVAKMPMFSIPRGFKRFCSSIKRGDIVQLLDSELIFKDSHDVSEVKFCRVVKLPEDKDIIIMSATAPIPVYKKLYGSRVVVIDITNIKPMGMIEQWTKRSFATTRMSHYNEKVYQELFNDIAGTKVITHLKHYSKFKNFSKLDDPKLTNGEDFMKSHTYYFGKCSGGDKLNGYDTSIVGTPNKPDFVYLFIAELIGLPNSEDRGLYDLEVEWNDFRFRFFTFGSKDLREIQLSLVEADLLQAAGRGRFLRNKNTTKIFSSLPLTITTLFHKD